MNKNVMIVLAGGFLIAILVALLVQASLSGGKKDPAPVVAKEVPKVQILVAAQDIAVGDKLSDQNMKWASWPKEGVFSDAVVQDAKEKPSAALQGRLKNAVKSGEPILKSAIVSEESNLLSASLSPGMRAVSIDVEPSAVVSGFVGPGDYVDIVLTYNERISYEGDDEEIQEQVENMINRMASETIMENIKVLAIDQTASRSEEDKIRVGRTVTLEVDKRGAETLALAKEIGELSLVLRSLGDKAVGASAYPVVTDARMTTIRDEVLREIAKQENSAGKKTNTVRIYSGSAMQEVNVSP